jgi:hypothetical protein
VWSSLAGIVGTSPAILDTFTTLLSTLVLHIFLSSVT